MSKTSHSCKTPKFLMVCSKLILFNYDLIRKTSFYLFFSLVTILHWRDYLRLPLSFSCARRPLVPDKDRVHNSRGSGMSELSLCHNHGSQKKHTICSEDPGCRGDFFALIK